MKILKKNDVVILEDNMSCGVVGSIDFNNVEYIELIKLPVKDKEKPQITYATENVVNEKLFLVPVTDDTLFTKLQEISKTIK